MSTAVTYRGGGKLLERGVCVEARSQLGKVGIVLCLGRGAASDQLDCCQNIAKCLEIFENIQEYFRKFRATLICDKLVSGNFIVIRNVTEERKNLQTDNTLL